MLITNKLFTITCLFLLASCYLKNIYLIGFSVVVLGFVDCCAYALNLAVVSNQGWGKRGFSIFNLGQCGGVVVSILVTMFASNQVYLLYVLILQIISTFFLHNFESKHMHV